MYAIQTESTPAAPPLTLTGTCGYAVENDRIVIDIAEIANHREHGNLSGTLAIELWALDRPYSGGGFAGTPMCSTRIGELRGQHVLRDCRYDLIFQAPPPGSWSLSLMLREWTDAGYLTRDYVNFTLPYVVERTAPIVRGETDNVSDVEFSSNQSVLATSAEPEATSPRAAAATAAVTAPSQPEPLPDSAISVNTASAKDAAAVKGVGEKLLSMVRQLFKQ
jgi:hypothetical protein